MQNVVQKLTFGSDNYMVGSSPLMFSFRTPANPDWSTAAQQMLTLVSINDTYDNTARTDYAQVVKELIGGRPVVINLANDNSDPDNFTITFASHAFKSGSTALIPIGTIGIGIWGASTGVTHYITGMIIASPGGITAFMMNNPPPSVLLKPIIIKTDVISGDPAVNDVITLTATEIYDTAKGSTVTAANLFSNGTAGRRLVVYVQGAGLTLIPCELLPVYNTDYTTPVLFSGFTGIKFRGGTRTNYYGLYIKLASDGTLTATVEDRQVYS